jgi:hypothetical protein
VPGLFVGYAINAHPDQIGRTLRSVRPITEGGENFVPALAAEHRTRNGILIPQSERVILSNLHETVVALANAETAPQVREAFYQHNPIPGTIWRIVNGTHVLVNPDEIMPQNYTGEDLHNDVDDYMRMFTWIQKKLPKFVKTAAINYQEKGDRAILVSNAQENLRIRDRQGGQALVILAVRNENKRAAENISNIEMSKITAWSRNMINFNEEKSSYNIQEKEKGKQRN